jgi:hypothetical protein
MQTRLLELSKFQPTSSLSLQEEITKKFCPFQICEEGAELNSATQNVVGYALALLLDPAPGDSDGVLKLIINNQRGVY